MTKWQGKGRGPRRARVDLSNLNRTYGAPTGDRPLDLRVRLAVACLAVVAIGTVWAVTDIGYALITAAVFVVVAAVSQDA